MKKIIAVDVDLTVVDTLIPWVNWYQKLTGHNIVDELEKTEWNIDALMHKHSSPMDFWKKSDLYDELKPFTEARINLDVLSEHFDIIFVSASYPDHTQSKEFFLQRNFPYMKAFISTGQKGYVKCDYFIDDYSKYIKQMQEGNPDCVCFQHRTLLNQDHKTYTWGEIKDEIFKLEGL